jgi:VWFA-related protein
VVVYPAMKRLLASAVSALLLGQPAQPPDFRAVTDVVEIDVVVHDKSGKFVRDLKPDDFELRDEGRPQPVELVTLVSAGGGRAPMREADSASPIGKAQARPRVFLAVFDDAHLSRENFRHAQTAARDLFAKEFHDGDLGGVVVGGQVVNRRLTFDGAELADAVAHATPSPKADSKALDFLEWPRMNEAEAFRTAAEDRSAIEGLVSRACSDDPDQCRAPLSAADAEQAIRMKAGRLVDDLRRESDRTLQILTSVLTNLQKFEGRKTLLLLSQGFAADGSWPEVKRVVELAARANARIYTLDARGLSVAGGGVLDRAPSDSQRRALDALGGSDDAINSLAVDTGGFVVRNTNNFGRAIAAIGDDAGTYYVLGYRPSRGFDGAFHRISVRVKRAGVDVRARRGYVAEAPKAATATVASPPALAPVSEPVTPAPLAATFLPAVAAFDAAAGFAAGETVATRDRGMRVRPDANAHTEALGSAASADMAARAGWDAYQRGDVEGAHAALSPLAERADTPSWVHYALGQADYALARYHDAIVQWEAVRDTAPDFEPVYFDLVDGYLQVKDRGKAVAVLSSAATRWSRDPDVYNALGVVHTAAGSIDDAVKAFGAAIQAAPSEPTSYLNLGIALETRYARSLRYFIPTKAWIGNDKDRDEAIAYYRRYLEFGGPYADAARARLEALKWSPTKKQ